MNEKMKDGCNIEPNGTKRWWQNDQLHRLDGPACEYANGDKYWYQYGKFHRLNGPAIEDANGYKAWCQNSQYHRLDGPAVERVNGDKFWFYKGRRIHCSSQQEFERLIKLKAFW